MSSPRKSKWTIPVVNRVDWNSYWKQVEEFLEPFSCSLVPANSSTRAELMIAEVGPESVGSLKKLLSKRQKLVIAVPLSSSSVNKNLTFIDTLAETSRKHPCLLVSLDNRINAALLALQIFSVGKSSSSKLLAKKLKKYKEGMRSLVLKQKLRK